MYVCLCNSLTDRVMKRAAADLPGGRPSDVYAACGCRAQCGACVKAVIGLLRDVTGANAIDEVCDGRLQGAD